MTEDRPYLAKFAVKNRRTNNIARIEDTARTQWCAELQRLDTYRASTSQLLRASSSLEPYRQLMERVRVNHSPHDAAFIQRLMHDPSITIKPADKNLGMALVDTAWYDAELLRMLSDPVTYSRFEAWRIVRGKLSPWSIQQEQLELLTRLRLLADHHEVDLCRWHTTLGPAAVRFLKEGIRAETLRIPEIYLLIKVHKASGLCGRPIVPSTHSVTTTASIVVDHLLQEIWRKAGILHVAKDTKSLITDFEQQSFNDLDGIFVTADIATLYTNIDTPMGLTQVQDFLHLYQVSLEHGNLIMALLRFVMENSYLSFQDDIYKQVDGTAMGTSCAPTYANIVVFMLERHAISKIGASLYIYRRYLDDVFAYVSRTHADELQVALNALHPKLRFECVTHPTSCAFLDLRIFKGNRFAQSGVLDLAVHQKSMNLYLYIPYLSFHPVAMKRSFIVTELTRYIRNSSALHDYVQLKQIFYTRLRDRGYPHAVLQPLFASVHYADRAYFLWPNSDCQSLHTHPGIHSHPPLSTCLLRRLARQARSATVPRASPPVFVVPYTPLSHVLPLRPLLTRRWEQLSSAFQLGLPQPLIAYQSEPSLLKQLVYTRARVQEAARKERANKQCDPPRLQQLSIRQYLRPTQASTAT